MSDATYTYPCTCEEVDDPGCPVHGPRRRVRELEAEVERLRHELAASELGVEVGVGLREEAETRANQAVAERDAAREALQHLGRLIERDVTGDRVWIADGYTPAMVALAIADALAFTVPSEEQPTRVLIARCPEHGLHGERDACFVCGGPVEQVPMVLVEQPGGGG